MYIYIYTQYQCISPPDWGLTQQQLLPDEAATLAEGELGERPADPAAVTCTSDLSMFAQIDSYTSIHVYVYTMYIYIYTYLYTYRTCIYVHMIT